jgi:hypothetical protein
VTQDGELESAFVGQAVTLTLKDEIDISRGDLLVRSDDRPHIGKNVRAHVVWMAERELQPARPYLFKQNTHLISGSVTRINHRIDVNTQIHHPADVLKLNEIGLIDISFNAALAFDAYGTCKATGSFIIIDRLTNATIGAGLIQEAQTERVVVSQGPIDRTLREKRLGQRGLTVWIPVSKKALASTLETHLFELGYLPYLLDDAALIKSAPTVTRALNDAGLLVLALGSKDLIPDGSDHLLLPENLENIEAILTWLGDQEALLL